MEQTSFTDHYQQIKKLILQLATRYDNLFNMIEVGLKLKQDVSKILEELNFRTIKQKQVNIYSSYLKSQDVSETRLLKISRLLDVIKVLLPEVTTVNMSVLDEVKDKLTKLPKRNIQKYRVMKIDELLKMDIPSEHRLDKLDIIQALS